VLTQSENAQNHVHIGNTELSLQVMTAWMTGLDTRDRIGRELGGVVPSVLLPTSLSDDKANATLEPLSVSTATRR